MSNKFLIALVVVIIACGTAGLISAKIAGFFWSIVFNRWFFLAAGAVMVWKIFFNKSHS